MKYLLQAISARRGDVQLPDPDLRQLLMDVRKGRDEKEEFFEAIERIITELRNYTEHSGPFLTRVSKREAPDYYDVIKNPMDLGTMLKKLRNNGYRNKKQFAHDLDLIWENCLVYNCDPAHPLRRSVHFMRKKANHLLEFVSDKSDVKDALSQWEANDHATAHQASSSFLNGTQSFGDDNRYSSPNLAGLTPFSRRPTGLNLSIGPSAASTEQKAKAKALKLAKIKRKKLKEKAKKKKKLRIIDSDDEEGGASKDKGKGKERASDDEDDQMDLDDDDDDDDDLDLDDDDDDDEDEDLQAEGEGEEGEVPFEQRPAIVKTQEAMQIFNNLDWGISKGEENQDQILYGSTETFNGNSKRLKKDSSYSLDQSLNLVKELGGNGRAGPLRAALIASTSTSTPLETSGNSSDDETQKQDSSKDPNPKPESSDVSMSEPSKPNPDSQQQTSSNQTKERSFFDLEQGGDSSDALSWWAAQSNDRLSGGALPNLKGSELIPTNLNGESGSPFQTYYSSSAKGKERERPAKRRMLTSSSSATISPLDFKNSQVTYSQPNGISSSSTSIPHPSSSSTSMPVATPDSALPKRLALARSRAGLRGMICENVRTIGKVKRTHRKFGKLSQISQMNPNELEEENNFASLLPSEEEETEDEDLNNYSDLDPEWSKSLPISVSNSKFSIAKDEDESKVEWRNPYSDLTTEAASDSVRGCVQTLLAHKGFDASHTSPLDVLAGAASEYMMNLGRTLRLYSDRYSHKMSAEEIILHTLHENSTADVAALESYIRDDVERHGSKMTDLLRKLRASYKERRKLHSEKAAAVEEAAFEDGADTFASGLFTSATGEDFFGFGSMGLADELGTSNLQIPSRLWYGKGKGSRPSGSGRYDGHDSNGIRSNSDPFPPPPPFVPLSAAGISAQIGLLKPFYLERARIQARRMLGKGETESGSASEVKPLPLQVQDPVQQGETSNGTVSDKESATHQGPDKPVESNAEEEEMKLNVVLEDEEHIKQKILPSGKLPTKRAMWGVDEIGSFDDEENPPTVSAKTRGVGRGNGGRGRGRGKKKKLAENGS